jgi:hypothetical protein
MKTSLSLLTSEGALVVSFASVLTPAQYARLYDTIRGAGNKSEMKEILLQFSQEVNVELVIDD